ncbi:hypothetical protein T484DRAFT_2678907 [Baffinella frigidus]|nr:hypothetical protein T484DRAFT_2678907 [Cryptophyta sp. CCMP2293]
MTYHDGAKRWYHCRECDYFNDRLYHCQMHYERIHVKEGKAIARKRKYPSTDLPDVIPAVPDVQDPVTDPSPRRSVSSTPHHHPKPTESHTPNTSFSAARTPLNVVGGGGAGAPVAIAVHRVVDSDTKGAAEGMKQGGADGEIDTKHLNDRKTGSKA